MTVWAIGVLAVTAAGWAYVFVPGRSGIWRRSWTTASVLTVVSVTALAIEDRLADAVGGIGVEAIASGLIVGAGWIVATQIGHAVLCRVVPGFLDQVRGLYAIAAGDRRRDILLALVSMAVAEEFVFRLVTQRELGIVVAVVAYAMVQVVERNGALVLAGAACGIVWGLLYEWQGNLVAPLIAHVAWTGTLTFLWPLGGCGEDAVPEADAVAVTQPGVSNG